MGDWVKRSVSKGKQGMTGVRGLSASRGDG